MREKGRVPLREVDPFHALSGCFGLHGVSARSGTMYGFSWTIGFIGIYLINSGLLRAGASDEVMALAWTALPVFLVGILYLAGAALWQTTVMYVLGTWFVLLAGVATVVGLPDLYLVMTTAGGGGMLVGALAAHIARRRFSAARGR